MTRHLINKAVMTQNFLEALNQNAQPLEKKAALSNFIIIIFLTPVLNSRGMKKLRYAIQKVQKSSWNEPYSSFLILHKTVMQ